MAGVFLAPRAGPQWISRALYQSRDGGHCPGIRIHVLSLRTYPPRVEDGALQQSARDVLLCDIHFLQHDRGCDQAVCHVLRPPGLRLRGLVAEEGVQRRCGTHERGQTVAASRRAAAGASQPSRGIQQRPGRSTRFGTRPRVTLQTTDCGCDLKAPV